MSYRKNPVRRPALCFFAFALCLVATAHAAHSIYDHPHSQQNELLNAQGLAGGSDTFLWDIGATGSGVRILVIDTGVLSGHNELNDDTPVTCLNTVLSGATTNGCPDDSSNASGHGTAIAAIAAADGNDGGMIGMAPESIIGSLQLRLDSGVPSQPNFHQDMNTIASQPAWWNGATFDADVIVLSTNHPYGGDATAQNNVCNAINAFTAAGKIVVAAAGNNNVDLNSGCINCQNYPPRCHLSATHPARFIVVAATDGSFTARQADSNYGSLIDLYAPGENVYGASKASASSYTSFTGTSFASPIVAGAVAQLLSCGIGIDQVEAALKSASVSIAQTGGARRRLNVREALASQNNPPTSVSPGISMLTENTPGGDFNLGALTATDPDTCNGISGYSIAGGADAASFSIVDNTSNPDIKELVLNAASLDHESKPFYSVDITVTDFFEATFTQTVTINIENGDDAPVIQEGDSIAVTMSEDGAPQAFSLGLLATDQDDNAELTWSIQTPASSGTAVASGTGPSPGTTTVTYTPNADFNGADIFVVRVSDNTAPVPLTDDITVNVTIEPVNDTPVITQGATISQTTTENDPVDFTLSASDVDSGTLTWSIAGAASNGVADASQGGTTTTPGGSKIIRYTPNAGYTGADSFTVQVTDGSDTAVITVNVTVTPDVPPAAPTDLNIVMDRSGSMIGLSAAGGSKINALKDAADLFVTQLSIDGTHRLGMTQFNSAVVPFTSPDDFPFQTINSANLAGARDAIDSITASGSTNILAGVQAGANSLDVATPQARRVVVLFTDGAHNSPSVLSDSALETEITSRLDSVSSDLEFYSLGFGTSVNDDALINVANAKDGWHVNELDVDPLLLGKNFTDVAQDVIGNQAVYDPVFDLAAGPQELKVPVNSRDRSLTFVVSWDEGVKPEEILATIQPPLGKCLVRAQAPGVKVAQSNTYRIFHFTLPFVCGGRYARAGEWLLKLDAKTREGRNTVRVNALSYVRSPLRLSIKAEVLRSLFANRLSLKTVFEDLAPVPNNPLSMPVLHPRFSAYIQPPLPRTRLDAKQDAEGVQPVAEALRKGRTVRQVDLQPDAGGKPAFPELRETGIYQVRIVGEATDENGNLVRRERMVSVYNEPPRTARWILLGLILLALLVVLILFLKRRAA